MLQTDTQGNRNSMAILKLWMVEPEYYDIGVSCISKSFQRHKCQLPSN